MPAITELPCEIINTVLRHLDCLRDLVSATRSCRHVYISFQENPHIAVDILQRQAGLELLPYAVAVMEASRLRSKTTENVQAVLSKLERRLKTVCVEPREAQKLPRRSLAKQLTTTPFSWLLYMSYVHSVIHSFVMAYSTSAWTHLSSQTSPAQGEERLSLSRKEYIRFCRAFYRMELYFRLFPRLSSHDEEASGAESFLRTFPAWEIEQIGCVQDFLELQFSRASRDVVAHDVFFGEHYVDYLTPGYMNGNRQTWLGQGICFVHQLQSETSYDAKHELLQSTFTSHGTDLHETLLHLYSEDQHVNDTPLKEYSKEKREALFQPSEPWKDADRGPFEAWWAATKELPLHSTLMMNSNAGLRDRAYVLWDEDRLKEYNLFKFFTENNPDSELELEDTEEEQLAMLKSFDARSRIWQRNGRGYWSEGDESRIQWPKVICRQ